MSKQLEVEYLCVGCNERVTLENLACHPVCNECRSRMKINEYDDPDFCGSNVVELVYSLIRGFESYTTKGDLAFMLERKLDEQQRKLLQKILRKQ